MNPEQIALVTHEANRAYCATIGDFSQKSWEAAEEWQRQSAIAGVQFVFDNPNAPPELQHLSWSAHKIADGWTYGPVKDAEKKQHPCLVPYDELPLEQQLKDALFGAIVKALCPRGVEASAGETDIQSGPVGVARIEGFAELDGEMVPAQVDDNDLIEVGSDLPEPEEGPLILNRPGDMPLSPDSDPASPVGAQLTPIPDASGQIYAIEFRRLTTTGGYNNLTIGVHALVDPAIGVDQTVRDLDRFVCNKLEEHGCTDVDDLVEQRYHLRSEIQELESRKSNVEAGLRKSRELYTQAAKTLAAVGVEVPFVRGPNPFIEADEDTPTSGDEEARTFKESDHF